MQNSNTKQQTPKNDQKPKTKVWKMEIELYLKFEL